MRRKLAFLVALVLPLLLASSLLAQGLPTGRLSGKVSSDGQPLPGVTVTAKSPNLQGTRSSVTGVNGDYALANLPPGAYTVTYEMTGFGTVARQVSLGASQVETLDVTMGMTAVAAVAEVAAEKETISTAPQSATTYRTDLLEKLPTGRTLLAAVTLSPGVTTNGPNNAVTVAGAMSFENLFTVNGVVVQDNIRSTPFNLFIEDAVQETTTSTSGVSAEFGRFTGGVVNTITKSGGNRFSGSFRTTFTNDDWSAKSPSLSVRDANYRPPAAPTQQTKVDDVVPRYEATLGGPVWKDRIWFFGAGRLEDQATAFQTSNTLLSYTRGDEEKRYEGKLTLTPFQNHMVTGSYIKIDREQTNYGFDAVPFMDLESTYTRQLPQELFAANYNGTLTSNLFVEAQYSKRQFSFENSGGRSLDLIQGTVGRDRSRGTAYFSPIFCGVCGPEQRDNDNYLVKGTYFLSTKSLGSHNIVVGYDNFGGQRLSNNFQSGSNYHIFTTGAIIRDGVVYPQINPASTLLVWYPIPVQSKGSDIRTHSVFVNDSWRFNNNLSFNIGLRWDKNDATDSFGTKTANDSAFSPRLAVAFDPTGSGNLRFSASYARYVAAPAENQASGGSSAGNPAVIQYIYNGPAINSSASAATLVSTAAAWQQVFSYFGITAPNQPANVAPASQSLPGVNLKIVGSLNSPAADEYTVGVAGRFLKRGDFRVDAVYRKYRDFYNERVDLTTGRVTNAAGTAFDFRVIENTDLAEREYVGLHSSFAYRVGGALSVGGNWTWSHAYGNFQGETAGSGPVRFANQIYPEYNQAAWNVPKGDLDIDQRHRVRVYASYDLPLPKWLGTLNLGAIQSWDTGTPYGASGTVFTAGSGGSNPAPVYVPNPGYLTPPTAGVTYWFTSRDAFRTDDIWRTDLSVNYSRTIGPVEVFLQPQVLNVFNNDGVFAVNTTVNTAAVPGGGRVDPATGAPLTGTLFSHFNPFTTVPVQRTGPTDRTGNWDYGPNFGKPTSFASYQLPRQVRISVGLRF